MEFFMTFENCVAAYESAGGTVATEEKVSLLLDAMPELYRSVVIALETIDSGLTMETVKSRLLREELRLKEGATNQQFGENTVALTVSKKSEKQVVCY